MQLSIAHNSLTISNISGCKVGSPPSNSTVNGIFIFLSDNILITFCHVAFLSFIFLNVCLLKAFALQ